MSFAIQTLKPFFIVMLIAAIIACGPIRKFADKIRTLENAENLSKSDNLLQIISFVLAFVVLLWCLIRLAGGSYNPFIYFRF